MKYLDIPKYRIRPKPTRFLIDKLFVLFVLGILLYIAIYVNYYLLGKTIPNYLNWMFIVSIIIILVLDLLVCFMKYTNYVYEFYEEKFVLNGVKTHEVLYSDIKHVSYNVNFIDKMFGTGSIIVELSNSKKVKLKYLENPNQAYVLMQKQAK